MNNLQIRVSVTYAERHTSPTVKPLKSQWDMSNPCMDSMFGLQVHEKYTPQRREPLANLLTENKWGES